MRYYLLTLKFLTPVHFGAAANGGSLDRITMSCSADTFFSALCNEAAQQSAKMASELVEKVKTGRLAFSSLLPYYRNEADDDLQLYLPKPLVSIVRTKPAAASFAELKQNATSLKKSKKAAFIRASEIKSFLAGDTSVGEMPELGAAMLTTKVNTRLDEPLPYHVGSYLFHENTGLYLICGAADEEDFFAVKELIEALGYSGIGGKRSSGYGKFELEDDEIELEEDACCYEDDRAIAEMLLDTDAAVQMAIAPILPAGGQEKEIKNGSYRLIRRSGFVAAPALSDGVKHHELYMLAEGACFDKRLAGCMDEQIVEGLEHNVYRNGIGMFVGLRKC